jgi:CheY-like chemotaxis protein
MDRVLIVDDEPGIRALMGRWAESLGWWAKGVSSAGEALEELGRNRYDVAVAEVGATGADGLWLAARTRDCRIERRSCSPPRPVRSSRR